MEKAPAGILQLLQSVDEALKNIRQEMENLNNRVYDLELKFQGDPYDHHGPGDDVASLRRSITDVESAVLNMDNEIYNMKTDISVLNGKVN